MYRGFRVVVNGHISLPFPCHTAFYVLLKGMLVVSRVCVSLLCCCPPGCLCVWLSPLPPGGFLSAFHLSTPSLPTSSSFEGLGFLGPILDYWGSASLILPSSFLSWPGASMEIWKFLRDLPCDPGPSRLQAIPS